MEILKEEAKVTYNPAAKYSWKRDDEFILNGQEFNIILNSLRAILLTEQAQNILMIDRANSVFEKILAKAVEDGKVKEVDQSKEQKP